MATPAVYTGPSGTRENDARPHEFAAALTAEEAISETAGPLTEENRQRHWNGQYLASTYSPLRHDDWISRHIGAPSGAASAIELGCGFGYLSELLLAKGYDVIATDIAPAALEAVAARVPGLKTAWVDLEQSFPFRDDSFTLAVADLCLHYFDLETTMSIISEIRRILEPAGMLCARVNSSTDYAHGAGTGREVEPGFYENEGHYKRFFDTEMIQQVFHDWTIVSVANYDLYRYTRHKNVFELVVRSTKERRASDGAD